jgi:hypothetical protein
MLLVRRLRRDSFRPLFLRFFRRLLRSSSSSVLLSMLLVLLLLTLLLQLARNVFYPGTGIIKLIEHFNSSPF